MSLYLFVKNLLLGYLTLLNCKIFPQRILLQQSPNFGLPRKKLGMINFAWVTKAYYSLMQFTLQFRTSWMTSAFSISTDFERQYEVWFLAKFSSFGRFEFQSRWTGNFVWFSGNCFRIRLKKKDRSECNDQFPNQSQNPKNMVSFNQKLIK